MTSADSSHADDRFLANAMAAFLQIAAVVLLVWWCLTITRPFLHMIIWGVIISVAIYPLHLSLSAKLGGRQKTSAIILALIGIAIIVLPTVLVAESTFGRVRTVGNELQSGSVDISPPDASVAEWPVIGEKVYAVWSDAAVDLEETLNKYEPQLKAAGSRAVSFTTSTLGAVFQFIFSVIIGAVLLMSAESGYRTSRNIMTSLAGPRAGNKITDMTIQTIRSVVKGVLGVAIIQTILAAVGLVVAGVPLAGVWALAILVLAIVQLPPLLVLGPIAFWYFSVADGTPATIFLIYALIVSVSDAFLKPMLLGRGVETPMLVILVGAIGGAITSGIMGLFVGAVILAIGYDLLVNWMAPDAVEEDTEAAAGA